MTPLPRTPGLDALRKTPCFACGLPLHLAELPRVGSTVDLVAGSPTYGRETVHYLHRSCADVVDRVDWIALAAAMESTREER